MNKQVINGIEINSLEDLSKLKPFIDNKTIKLNIARISRELDIDSRTTLKYINGFKPKKTRNKKSKLDDYYTDIVKALETNKFDYKRSLYLYLKERYNIDIPEVTFRYYINIHPELDKYFK